MNSILTILTILLDPIARNSTPCTRRCNINGAL